jgi:hypothetical protein
MTARFTKKDIRSMIESLESVAKLTGVMPRTAELVYSPGNSSCGISASIDCYEVNEEGHRKTVAVRFLPEFTYKSTLREQARSVQAAFNALYAVSMKD